MLYMKNSLLLKIVLKEVILLTYILYCKSTSLCYQVHLYIYLHSFLRNRQISMKTGTTWYNVVRDTLWPWRIATHSFGSTTPRLSSSFLLDSAYFFYSSRSAPLARHRWQHVTLIPFGPLFFILSSLPACDWGVATEPLPVRVSVLSEWVSEPYCTNSCHYCPEFTLYCFVFHYTASHDFFRKVSICIRPCTP
jgi:hypothetical protein